MDKNTSNTTLDSKVISEKIYASSLKNKTLRALRSWNDSSKDSLDFDISRKVVERVHIGRDPIAKANVGNMMDAFTEQCGEAFASRIEFDLLETASKSGTELNWEALFESLTSTVSETNKKFVGVVMTPLAFVNAVANMSVIKVVEMDKNNLPGGVFATIGGLPVVFSQTLQEVDPTVECVVLEQDAIELDMGTLPIVTINDASNVDHTNVMISTTYKFKVGTGVVVVRSEPLG